MATVWQGGAGLTPAAVNVNTESQRLISGALLAPALVWLGNTTSTFLMLQALLDDLSLGDVASRDAALAYLLSYHTASLSNDKYTAAIHLNRIYNSTQLYLDHLWNVFGPAGVPINRPSPSALAELVNTVATARSTAGLNALAGPNH